MRMQFNLSEDACDRIDGLLIEFASSVFGGLPSADCLDQIRFRSRVLHFPTHAPMANHGYDKRVNRSSGCGDRSWLA